MIEVYKILHGVSYSKCSIQFNRLVPISCYQKQLTDQRKYFSSCRKLYRHSEIITAPSVYSFKTDWKNAGSVTISFRPTTGMLKLN